MFITIFFVNFFIVLIDIAAAVPITVANIAEIAAIKIVLKSAHSISLSLKSFIYQFKVKPVQTDLLLELLKEKTIKTNKGA